MKILAPIVQVKDFIKIPWISLLVFFILSVWKLIIPSNFCINNEVRKLHVFICISNFVHMVCSVFHFVQLDSSWLEFHLDFVIMSTIFSYVLVQLFPVLLFFRILLWYVFRLEFWWLSSIIVFQPSTFCLLYLANNL